MRISCALMLVFGMVGGTIACAAEPNQAATSELPAALRMVGATQEHVVSREAAHQVRGQLFLSDTFDFSQTKNFEVAAAVSKGTVNLLEGATGNYQYSLTETAVLDDLTKTITLLVDGQFAGLGGGIGVSNDTTDLSTFGSLNFVVGGKFLNEAMEFQGGQFNQIFSQTFLRLPDVIGGG